MGRVYVFDTEPKFFNHPNFRLPTNYLRSPLFGQATQMLGSSLGTGGLHPLSSSTDALNATSSKARILSMDSAVRQAQC